MNRYQLAKLVEWAGELKTRKRLQKVVYLLQAAGCPLNAQYMLHHYGPYSHEVAELTDDMVRVGLLEEDKASNLAGGQSFSYCLSNRARDQLQKLEQQQDDLAQFEALAKQLLGESVPNLEYGATVAYFHKQGKTWDEAREAAAKFKDKQANSQIMQDAERLARSILEPRGNR